MDREGERSRPEVFISYARESSRGWAEKLHQELARARVEAFLDTEDIGPGERIAEGVFEGLLGARVVVVFAGGSYFRRRYCAKALAVALAAYRALRQRGGEGGALEEAVLPVVVALPESGERPQDLEQLPPEVAGKNWPQENESGKLTDLVRDRLGQVGRTIRQRLQGLGELEALRERLYEVIAIPQPRSLGGVRLYHETGLPPSIWDAFVGREWEMWVLHTMLASPQPGAAALTTALEGGGGFGWREEEALGRRDWRLSTCPIWAGGVSGRAVLGQRGGASRPAGGAAARES